MQDKETASNHHLFSLLFFLHYFSQCNKNVAIVTKQRERKMATYQKLTHQKLLQYVYRFCILARKLQKRKNRVKKLTIKRTPKMNYLAYVHVFGLVLSCLLHSASLLALFVVIICATNSSIDLFSLLLLLHLRFFCVVLHMEWK